MEWNPVNWEFDIIFIYRHIAHRMQTMQRGRCNRRLWCLREVQRLERQNEPLLDINLSMMKKQFVFVRYGICKRKQTKVLHPACLAEGRITGTYWCKSHCKMGSKKNDGRCRIFRTKSVENWYGRRLLVLRWLFRGSVRKHKSVVFQFVWHNRLRSEIFAGIGFLGLCTELWTLFLSWFVVVFELKTIMTQ